MLLSFLSCLLAVVLSENNAISASPPATSAISADSLYTLAKQHLARSDTSTGFQLLDSALAQYVTNKDTLNQSRALNIFGYNHYYLGNLDQSLNYYQQALELDRRMADTTRIIGRLKNIGIVYHDKGLAPIAFQYYTEALDLARAIGNQDGIASVSNSLALLSSKMERFTKALSYYRTALREWTSDRDTLRMAYAYNNIGQVHLELERYDSALVYFQQAKRWKEMQEDQASLATTLHNLGNAYTYLDSIAQARKYLRAAYAIARNNDLNHELAVITHSLAQLHLITREFPRARHYLDTAQLLTNELNSRTARLEHWKLEAEYHEAAGQPTRALAYHKRWAALQDSIYHEERLQVVELQAAYSLQQEEQARQQAEAEATRARADSRFHQLLFWIVLAAKVIFIGLSLTLYRLYKAYRRLSQQNELLVQEQHHRMKNNLSVVASLLRMHARRLEDKGARQAMAESEHRIHTMELIHRRLYDTEISQVGMREYIEALVQGVLASYGYEVDLHLDIEDCTLEIDKAARVGLIINEVVTNACKYAFPEHPNPALRVSFGPKSSSTYQLLMQDNGPGFDPNQVTRRPSFGHKLIHLLADQLRGHPTYENRDGTLFRLTFPK